MSKIAPEVLKSSSGIGKVEQDDIRESDPNKTNEYKLKNMFFYRDEHGELVQYSITVGLDEFLKQGLGLYLYFKFLKQLMIVFLVMSICASVNCYFNSVGDGLDSWKNLNLLQKLSVGNQERIAASSGSTYTSSDIQTFYDDSNQQKNIITWIDFGYTLVFMLFYIYFTFSTNNDVQRQISNEKVPATFSIAMKGMKETDNNPNDLKLFMESLGYKIKEVVFAKNYSNTLLLQKEEAELKIKIQCEDLKQKLNQENFDPNLKAKLLQKLAEKQQERKNIFNQKFGKQLKHNDYPTLMAFVIFQRVSDKALFIKEYEEKTNLGFFSSKCLGKEVESKYKYKGDILRIIPKIDNPSNINWENLEVTPSNRLLRIILIGFFVFCLMIITFFIVFAVNIVSKYSPEDCPNRDYTYENTQLWISQATTTSSKTQIQQCFCMNQSLTTLYTSYTSYCSDIILQYTGIQGLQIASAFVILIVNALLQLLIKNVESFERFASLSKALSGTLINLFISLFVNTALITLILKANIYGFELSYYLSSPIPPLQSAQKNEVFPDDFNRDWYAVAGAAYINTWIINVFSPYFIDLLLYKIRVWWREKQAAKAKIQREQNHLSVGPEFRLDLYYANVLNTVFVTLFYSSLIPLMLPLGFLAICMHFFVQKFLLLNYYKKPPSYDEALHQSAMQILPFSIIFHILIAIWGYGHPYIFPYSTATLKSGGDYVAVNEDSVWMRISNSTQLAILGALFVAILILKYFFINPFAYVIGLCCDQGIKIEHTEKECTYDDIYEDISSYQLATYEISQNEKYKDLILAMDQRDSKITDQNEENLPLQDC